MLENNLTSYHSFSNPQARGNSTKIHQDLDFNNLGIENNDFGNISLEELTLESIKQKINCTSQNHIGLIILQSKIPQGLILDINQLRIIKGRKLKGLNGIYEEGNFATPLGEEFLVVTPQSAQNEYFCDFKSLDSPFIIGEPYKNFDENRRSQSFNSSYMTPNLIVFPQSSLNIYFNSNLGFE